MRVALVGCGKTKLDVVAPASELYTGNLFRSARAYAERNADRWFVLSALHGLVAPSKLLAPYNVRLSELTRAGREQWGLGVAAALAREVGQEAELVLLAGRDYGAFMPHVQNPVQQPLAGLGVGQRLQWFAQRRREQADKDAMKFLYEEDV